jgi:hypothetical protein
MRILTAILLILSSVYTGCVQKAFDKTVVYTLTIEGYDNIESVGIRGSEKPLSWDSDYSLTILKPDSLYQATVTYKTGYKYTEAKFVLNGEFELQDKPNRRIEFSTSDTTFYEATFNKVK